MKKILYMAATVLLCSSCFHVNSNYKGSFFGGKDAIKGEGPVISKSFDLKDFDRIVINGQADAVFTQSDTYEVTLRAQENVFDYVDYRVEGTTLILELKDKRTTAPRTSTSPPASRATMTFSSRSMAPATSPSTPSAATT